MYNALVIDDDYLVRSYLKTLDTWGQEEFLITADVRDGEEALEVLKDKEIDLVLTDISMPLMDGIELIRSIRSKDKDVYIIVLSCHDDFKYVKEAMKLGADEYILKNSLKEETLAPVLKQARSEIIKRKAPKETIEIKNNIIEDLENENENFILINKVLSGIETDQENSGVRSYFNSAVISIIVSIKQMTKEEEIKIQRLRKKIENQLGDVAIYLGRGVLSCFLDLSDEHRSSEMRQQLIRSATACYRLCVKEEMDFRVGVSEICMGHLSVRQAFMQSREAIKQGFYSDKQIIYYSKELKSTKEIPKSAKEMLKYSKTLFYLVSKEEYKGLCENVCIDFEELRTLDRSVIHWLRHLGEDISGKEQNYNYIVTINQVKEVLDGFADTYFSDEGAIPETVTAPVKKAVGFVLKNYKNPIGLSETAEEVGVNASYLSYIFSKEMGIGFSTFLLNQRIDCAKKMLRDSDMKITEIALCSGFNDYHYFAKTFKKVTGVSPANYRKDDE